MFEALTIWFPSFLFSFKYIPNFEIYINVHLDWLENEMIEEI